MGNPDDDDDETTPGSMFTQEDISDLAPSGASLAAFIHPNHSTASILSTAGEDVNDEGTETPADTRLPAHERDGSVDTYDQDYIKNAHDHIEPKAPCLDDIHEHVSDSELNEYEKYEKG